MCAMSGTRGSSGFGSHSKEHMDNNTGKKIRSMITTYPLYTSIKHIDNEIVILENHMLSNADKCFVTL